MWAHSPVLISIVFIWIILFVIGKEGIKSKALLEIFGGLDASNVLEEVKVTMNINASSNKSLPVNALQLQIGIIVLVLEVEGLAEIDVWSLDRVHVLSGGLELMEIEVLRKYFHYVKLLIKL